MLTLIERQIYKIIEIVHLIKNLTREPNMKLTKKVTSSLCLCSVLFVVACNADEINQDSPITVVDAPLSTKQVSQAKATVDTVINADTLYKTSAAKKTESTKSWDEVKKSSEEVWEKSKKISQDAIEAGKDTTTGAWKEGTESSKKMWESSKEKSKELWESSKKSSQEIWDKSKETSEELWKDGKQSSKELWQEGSEKLDKIFEESNEPTKEDAFDKANQAFEPDEI